MNVRQSDVFKKIKSDAPLIFAHRGASSDAPENTMAAFRLAKKYRTDGIELDLHLSADGHLVVIHDYTLSRTARTSAGRKLKSETEVSDLTLAQLKQYDVGVWFSKKYAGEKIPTLCEVMDAVGPDILLDIEIKADMRHPYKKLSAALAAFLHQYSKKKSIRNVFVSSFHPLALNYFRKTAKKLKISVPIALLYGTDPRVPCYMRRGQGALLCNPDIMRPLYPDVINKKDLSGAGVLKNRPIIAWTADDEAVARKLIAKKISGLVTNRPQEILNLKKKTMH